MGISDYPHDNVLQGSSITRELRTRERSGATRVAYGPLVLDTAKYEVSANGRTLQLSLSEFKLLHFLMRHPDEVESRERLVDAISTEMASPRRIDNLISRLRTKLRGHGIVISGIRGMGYSLMLDRDRSDEIPASN